MGGLYSANGFVPAIHWGSTSQASHETLPILPAGEPGTPNAAGKPAGALATGVPCCHTINNCNEVVGGSLGANGPHGYLWKRTSPAANQQHLLSIDCADQFFPARDARKGYSTFQVRFFKVVSCSTPYRGPIILPSCPVGRRSIPWEGLACSRSMQ
jgi:hypothetical protein